MRHDASDPYSPTALVCTQGYSLNPCKKECRRQTLFLALLKFVVPIEKTKVKGAVSSAEARPPHILFFIVRLAEEIATGMYALDHWQRQLTESQVRGAQLYGSALTHASCVVRRHAGRQLVPLLAAARWMSW